MARTREDLLGIIKALLVKTSDRGATPQEAAAAAQKATELMAKWNIDRREAVAHGEEEAAPIECIKFAFAWQSYYDIARRSLLRIVAKHNFCRIVWSENKTIANLIGQAHNEQVVEYLFTYLHKQIFDMATADFNVYKRKNNLAYADVTAKFAAEYKINFYEGAVEVIDVRLQLMSEDATPQTKALVISIDADLKAAQAKFFPSLSYSPEAGYGANDSAHAAGRQAGASIGIHKGMTSNAGTGFTRQIGSGRR